MSAVTPTRRGLFAGGAALAAVSAIPALPAGAAAHPDAELLAACARFCRAEAEYRRLNGIECAVEDNEAELLDASPALQAASAALQVHVDGEYEAARGALLDAPDPTTPEGLHAVAETTWQFYQPEPPERHGMGAMLWTVVCAVAGRPCETTA